MNGSYIQCKASARWPAFQLYVLEVLGVSAGFQASGP
jgi:hypothetical protein